MWNKLYLLFLGISLVTIAFFTYYSWSWLQSIGQAEASVAGYEYHASIAWTALWISTTCLLLLGNAVLWASRRSWAMWATFVYFSTFIILRLFWLDEAFFYFRKANGLFDGSFSIGPFFAVILIALMAAIIFFDQFIVVRLYQKMFSSKSKKGDDDGELTSGTLPVSSGKSSN